MFLKKKHIFLNKRKRKMCSLSIYIIQNKRWKIDLYAHAALGRFGVAECIMQYNTPRAVYVHPYHEKMRTSRV